MESTLIELIDELKNLAPQVWEIMLKQVKIDAVVNFLSATLFFSFILVSVLLTKHFWEKIDESFWKNEIIAVEILLLVGSTLSGIHELVVGIKFLLNPEYYAILEILGKLK